MVCEPAAVWSPIDRRSGRDRECGECGAAIAKGERYRSVSCLLAGEGWDHLDQCAACAAIWDGCDYREPDEGPGLGALLEWLSDGDWPIAPDVGRALYERIPKRAHWTQWRDALRRALAVERLRARHAQLRRSA